MSRSIVLKGVYYSPEREAFIDSISTFAWTKLAEVTSQESVNHLNFFIEEYAYAGGNDLMMAADYSANQPDIIKTLIYKGAGIVDAISEELSSTRARTEPCLAALEIGIAGGFVDDHIWQEIILALSVYPPAEVAARLAEVGIDFYTALRAIENYHKCTKL